MSSLAVMALREGNNVQGYDARPENRLLQIEGVKVSSQLDFCSVEKCDELIYSSAFNENFPLISYAKRLKKPCCVRGKFLARIAKNYQKVVAVAGAHGKSTVTAMIFHILKVAGKRPTLHLGAYLKEGGQNFFVDGDEFFVTEACEYHDNFLYLKPYLGVVTNVEGEHLDYFRSLANVKKSFQKFEKNCQNCVKETSLKAKSVKLDRLGRLQFEVLENGKKLFDVHLTPIGLYNVKDALFAIEACRKLGVQPWQIKLGLESFRGLEKRFEKVKSSGACKVFLDYAHHPKEIESVLETCGLLKGKKVCVFQPHTYSRTKAFLPQFVNALSLFDEVFLFKTYAARESEDLEVELQLLKGVSENKDCILFYCESALIDRLKNLTAEDNLIIMGAGDLPEILQSSNFICRD